MVLNKLNMKRIYLIIAAIFVASFAMSQSRYTVVQFNKKDVPGVVGEIPFVESTVRECTLLKKLDTFWG
jgi:hypothetical protein